MVIWELFLRLGQDKKKKSKKNGFKPCHPVVNIMQLRFFFITEATFFTLNRAISVPLRMFFSLVIKHMIHHKNNQNKKIIQVNKIQHVRKLTTQRLKINSLHYIGQDTLIVCF